jgi:GAF domain-containing protein/HAMP domain-containing protein
MNYLEIITMQHDRVKAAIRKLFPIGLINYSLKTLSHQAFRLRLVFLPIVMVTLSILATTYYTLESVESILETTQVETNINDQARGDAVNFNTTVRPLIIQRIILVSIMFIGLFGVVGIFIINRLFDPVSILVKAAHDVTEKKWDVYLPVKAPGEIGLLANAFGKMKEELRNNYVTLEERVVERTLAFEQKSLHLQAASEVAREIVATRNFDILVGRAVDLLSERFNFYHVGLYLVDPQGEYAVLQAAPGQTGREMINQGHRLRVSHTSVVGYVANSGEPRFVHDIKEDPYHFHNPLLPQTRSELAIPLIISQKVIGVLDVQSDKDDEFDLDDLEVLQTLADQLSIAIETAKLFQEHNELKYQLEELKRQVSQEAWSNVSQQMKINAYQYDASGIKPMTHRELEEIDSEPPISIPIQTRGETVSYLDVWPQGEELSPVETRLLDLLKERLSQAIESARLFEETQKGVGRERAVNEFVSKLSTTLDLENLLQTAVKQFGELPGISEVEIVIDPVVGADDRQADIQIQETGQD